MISEIITKELRENLYTVRFFLILILTVFLFTASSIIFVSDYHQRISDYRNDISENENLLNEKSENLCNLAKYRQILIRKPNPLEFLSEANEKYLPNKFETNIFGLSYPKVEGRANILLREYSNIDWEFIVGVVLSFLAFVLSYDAMCGEKEQKTLSLIFSNPVKTVQVFFGKFSGLLITLFIPFLTGVIISLFIMNFVGNITFNYGKIILFLFASFIYLSLFLLIGMSVSSLFFQSTTSAVTLLFIWIIFAFVIPAGGNLIAHNIYPIQTKAKIQEKISITWDDIYETKYANTNAGRWDGDPFKPWVPLRSQWMEDILNARNQIFENYIQQMLNQVERTKTITKVSPVSVFEYLTEEISGTGISRFNSFYSQINQYKRRLYNFVEEIDKLDSKSPHLIPLAYTMNQGISKLPVEFSSIPKFEETLPSIMDNIKKIVTDLAILMSLWILFFYAGYILLVRYDKR